MFTPAQLQLFARLLIINLNENVAKFATASLENGDERDNGNTAEKTITDTMDDVLSNDENADHCSSNSANVKAIINSSINNNNNIWISGTQQHQTNCAASMEPPTPPRTPVNTSSATTAGSGLGCNSFGGQQLALDDSVLQHANATLATASSTNILPMLTVASASKLLAATNNNNQQNLFNNNEKSRNELKRGGNGNSNRRRPKRSAHKNGNNSDVDDDDDEDADDDGDNDADVDDDDQKSNSTAISAKRKQKRDRNYHHSVNSKHRNSDATHNLPISDFDDDDVDDDAPNNCDGGQRSSSDSGDENLSDLGSTSSKRTHGRPSKGGHNLGNVDNFGVNDASFDSISASIFLQQQQQQQKGDAVSMGTNDTSNSEYFDKSSLVSLFIIYERW